MGNNTLRYMLLGGLLLVGLVLFNNWEIDHAPASSTRTTENTKTENAKTENTNIENKKTENNNRVNTHNVNVETSENTENTEIPETKLSAEISEKTTLQTIPADRLIHVETDVLQLQIDRLGGDVVQLKLPAYGETKTANSPGFTLLDYSDKRFYEAQSGLTGNNGPDIRGVGRGLFTTTIDNFTLTPGTDTLIVDLIYKPTNTKAANTKTASNASNGNTATNTKTESKPNPEVSITKRFIFERGSYLIQVQYIVNNQSQTNFLAYFYGRLKQREESEKKSSLFGIQTFTGAAVNTPDTPYKKLSFSDIADKGFKQDISGGWAAMVEHYFVSAWIPDPKLTYTYQASKMPSNVYGIEFISPLIDVPPMTQKIISANLYAGPEETSVLKKIAPGLELSVDYGILWPICQPIFWVLKQINSVVGNWGFSIIIITILIKLLFFKLSASSYRSMGNMRKLQPRIEALKERYGDDKQKFSQAVMELYRKEKVNPLGGCLPILVQIPVFIALYYVLLGSVDLRHAPFILWINDLSAKDPYYVLPILMGISMLIQQKLSPAPPDPVQAKVMMAMPIVFTVLFLNFPAGLMLYWVVNNLLSILQQWYITTHLDKRKHHGAQ